MWFGRLQAEKKPREYRCKLLLRHVLGLKSRGCRKYIAIRKLIKTKKNIISRRASNRARNPSDQPETSLYFSLCSRWYCTSINLCLAKSSNSPVSASRSRWRTSSSNPCRSQKKRPSRPPSPHRRPCPPSQQRLARNPTRRHGRLAESSTAAPWEPADRAQKQGKRTTTRFDMVQH